MSEKKDMLAPSIVLVCICLVASMLLAATYQITKPIIDNLSIQMANESRAEVLPEADGFTQMDVDLLDGVTEVYKAANPQMASMPGFKNMFVNAPAVIAVAAPDDTYNGVNAGLLGENIMLAAQSLGLGTCCLGAPTRFLNSTPEAAPYRDRLGINPGYQILYMIAVGYPDESPEAKPRDLSKIRFVD